MTTGHGEKPDWWRPGMTDREIADWEAAARCATNAPRIERGDAVWMALLPLVGGWLKPAARDRAA